MNQCFPTRMRTYICPEIWRRIFYLATCVEEDLSPLGSDMFDGMHFERRRIAREEASGIRRALILVCKWWNKLALEFLYTHVSLSTFHQLSQFAEILQNYESSRSPGWWTNRLDIRSIELTSNQYQTQYADLVVQIIQRCPNLCTFVIGDETLPNHDDNASRVATPPAILRTLAESSCRSLKRFEWDGPGAPSPKELAHLLPSCPQLRNICMTDCADVEPGDEVAGLAGISFPHLKVLELTPTSSWQLSVASTWHLPSLTNVTIMEPISDEGSLQSAALEKFFDAQGTHIQSLAFIIAENFDLGSVYRLCPNLTELVFTLSSGFYPLRGISVQKNVKRVGIYNLHTYIPWGEGDERCRRVDIAELHDAVDMLNKHLSELASSSFPSLKIIRLFHFTTIDAIRWTSMLQNNRIEWWKSWVLRLEQQGIRFEGNDGKLITNLLG